MKTSVRRRMILNKETLVHLNSGEPGCCLTVTQGCCSAPPYCNTRHTNCSICHTCDSCFNC